MVVVHPVEHDLRSAIPASCNVASHLVLRWPDDHHYYHLHCCNDDDERDEQGGNDDDNDKAAIVDISVALKYTF